MKPMKPLLIIMIIATLAFSSISAAQKASEDAKILKAFTIPITIDGGPVWATVVNDRTSQILWRSSPSRESLRSGAAGTGLTLYVMGLVTKDFEVSPEYSIVQGKTTSPGKAINIKNLSGGPVKQGDLILGLIEFSNKIDLTRPFTLKFSGCSVETALNPDDVKQWGAIAADQKDPGEPPTAH
jgi:hypothetical protein